MTYPEQYGDQETQRAAQGGYQYQRRGYRQNPHQQGPRHRAYPSAPNAPLSAEPERSGGAEGNERLTVMTGTVLLFLLAAEGLTILSIGRLLTPHIFLGMLLLGPVALKGGSVLYRFTRYYGGSAPYRRKGPPAPFLRLLGPVVLLLTAAVFGSGIMLAVVGPAGEQPWLLVHKASFFLWFAATALHVLAYLPRLPGRLYAEARGVALGGRGVRLSLLIASLVAGLVIALLTVHLAGAWESPGRFFHP